MSEVFGVESLSPRSIRKSVKGTCTQMFWFGPDMDSHDDPESALPADAQSPHSRSGSNLHLD